MTRAADERVDYTVSAEFAGFGVESFEALPGFTGCRLVRADSRTGRMELESTGATLDWPPCFANGSTYRSCVASCLARWSRTPYGW